MKDHNEPISNFMATKLITFKPKDDIWDAIKVFVRKKISGAPVINDKGDLIGMLSEADCIRVILEDQYNKQPGGKGCVEDFMTSEVTTIDSESTLMDAAYAFAHSNFRRFPVIENGKLVGQLSRSDILTAISKLKPEINIVPDSWRPRMPLVKFSKQGRYSKNA